MKSKERFDMKESYSKRSMLLKENEYWTSNLYSFDLPEHFNSAHSMDIEEIEDSISNHNSDLTWHEMSLEQHYDGSYYVVLRYRGQGSQIEEILYDIIEDLTQNEYDSKEDFISAAKKEIQDGAGLSEELSGKIANKLSDYLSNNGEETYNDFDFGEKVDYNKPLYLVEDVEDNILSCDFGHEYADGGIQDDGSIEWICMDDEFDKAVKIMDEMEKDYDEFAEELKKEYGEEEEEEDIEESRSRHGRMLNEGPGAGYEIYVRNMEIVDELKEQDAVYDPDEETNESYRRRGRMLKEEVEFIPEEEISVFEIKRMMKRMKDGGKIIMRVEGGWVRCDTWSDYKTWLKNQR